MASRVFTLQGVVEVIAESPPPVFLAELSPEISLAPGRRLEPLRLRVPLPVDKGVRNGGNALAASCEAQTV